LMGFPVALDRSHSLCLEHGFESYDAVED
jgi:hypothetical protein